MLWAGPSRETVSTSRESQANLLQALELTKGERFNDALKKGAENWKKKYRADDAIIKELYSKALKPGSRIKKNLRWLKEPWVITRMQKL